MSEWTSSRGREVRQEVLGNGFACILPAKHGSHSGSGTVLTPSCILVISFHSMSTFTSVMLWWAGKSSMPQGQIQWNSGRWTRILSDGLCHTIQKGSIVLIDGDDKQWWSIQVTEGHMGGIDMYIN